MSNDIICPDPDQIAQLMVGDLPEPEVDAICDHVLACEVCTTILRNLPNDETFLPFSSPKFGAWTADPDERRAIEQLMTRLQSLSLHPESNIRSGSQRSSNETPRFSDHESTPRIESTTHVTELAKTLLRPPKSAGELGWLGSYRVLGVLGSGGMGVVFEAEDPHLARRVAIKAMQPSLFGREEHKLRFLREARAVASIDHDNIVPIHLVGEDGDVPSS